MSNISNVPFNFAPSPSSLLYIPGRSHQCADGHVTRNHVSHELPINVHSPKHPKTDSHHSPRGSVQVVNPPRYRVTSRAQDWKQKFIDHLQKVYSRKIQQTCLQIFKVVSSWRLQWSGIYCSSSRISNKSMPIFRK